MSKKDLHSRIKCATAISAEERRGEHADQRLDHRHAGLQVARVRPRRAARPHRRHVHPALVVGDRRTSATAPRPRRRTSSARSRARRSLATDDNVVKKIGYRGPKRYARLDLQPCRRHHRRVLRGHRCPGRRAARAGAVKACVAQTFRWHPNPNSTETDEYAAGSVLDGAAAEAALRLRVRRGDQTRGHDGHRQRRRGPQARDRTAAQGARPRPSEQGAVRGDDGR
jgi:hypothetical protein